MIWIARSARYRISRSVVRITRPRFIPPGRRTVAKVIKSKKKGVRAVIKNPVGKPFGRDHGMKTKIKPKKRMKV